MKCKSYKFKYCFQRKEYLVTYNGFIGPIDILSPSSNPLNPKNNFWTWIQILLSLMFISDLAYLYLHLCRFSLSISWSRSLTAKQAQKKTRVSAETHKGSELRKMTWRRRNTRTLFRVGDKEYTVDVDDMAEVRLRCQWEIIY